MKNKEVRKLVREELSKIINEASNINYEKIYNIKYITQILAEILTDSSNIPDYFYEYIIYDSIIDKDKFKVSDAGYFEYDSETEEEIEVDRKEVENMIKNMNKIIKNNTTLSIIFEPNVSFDYRDSVFIFSFKKY